MATINEVKELLEYRANKSGYLGYLSPKDFNLIWNRAEKRHFNAKYKTYDTVEASKEALHPFKTDPITISIPNTGTFTKQADLLRVDAIRATYEGKEVPVVKVEEDRLASYLSSSYNAPTLQFPIFVEYNNTIQFYPTNLTSAKIVYLKNLTPSFWGYTVVGQRAVYDEDNSVDPIWDEMNIDEIIYLCGQDMGLNMRDQEVEAFNLRKQQQGSI